MSFHMEKNYIERGLVFDFQCFIIIKGDYSENMKRFQKNLKTY